MDYEELALCLGCIFGAFNIGAILGLLGHL